MSQDVKKNHFYKKIKHSSSQNIQKKTQKESDHSFLPMSREEMQVRGWDELDILLISGDAYIDHPSFAIALLGRHLEAHGYRVGIIAQPRWDTTEDFLVMGRPRLFAGVSAGAIDSMLAHYTAFRKKRSDDAYTEGGKAGKRPNRAVTVYTNLLRQAFPKLPIVAGGIEASLRRVSHYDFWTDSLKKSLLPDAKLDLLMYGMGEKAILEIAQKLDTKEDYQTSADVLQNIRGTARIIKKSDIEKYPQAMILPSHEDILADKKLLIKASLLLEQQVHNANKKAIQAFAERAILVEEPSETLTTQELDQLYDLPFTRQAHFSYKERIPAVEMIQTSITSHRGCGGGCSFCSLAIHQSRHISSRSEESILKEIHNLNNLPKFHGHISDIGGPSANMWNAKCKANPEKCTRVSCMFPKICKFFDVDQAEHIELLHKAKEEKNIKSVRIASGIRFDLALQNTYALNAYTGEFTGGQLKVAPEHCVGHVLDGMRKPNMELFEQFLDAFYAQSEHVHKEQYVIPYLMSAFPGCTDSDMHRMKEWLKARNWKPQQVQCFIPTPATVATACFYAECDVDGNPLFVAKSDAQRLKQHYLLTETRGQKPYTKEKENQPKSNQSTKNTRKPQENSSRKSPNNRQRTNKYR